ncbi:MAG: hypothetical protein ACFFDN_20145 [Candidatus Hodarchaeota archaeon]
MSTRNLLVMCEFGGMGMIRDLRFEKKYIKDHRRAVVLISEYHQTMWVWMGNGVTMKTRKQPVKVTEKFTMKGYKIDGEVLGQELSNVVIMDERTIDAGTDAQMMQNHQDFLAMMDSINVVPHGTSTHIVEVQAAGQAQAQPQGQVTAATTLNIKDEALAGIFLISLLHEFPDAFISRTSAGIIQIETSTGENFKFKVDQNIQMIQGTINQNIQNVYAKLLQALK